MYPEYTPGRHGMAITCITAAIQIKGTAPWLLEYQPGQQIEHAESANRIARTWVNIRIAHGIYSVPIPPTSYIPPFVINNLPAPTYSSFITLVKCDEV